MGRGLSDWVMQFPRLQKKSRVLWQAIYQEFEDQGYPMTVRQVFYRMSSAGMVAKSESGYGRVQYALLKMRRAGAIPYDYIADSTRWVRKSETYRNISAALEYWQRSYRRALWEDQDAYVEIWLEKDALAGVIFPVTDKYDVPLYVTRGYSSETFLYEAAQSLTRIYKPIFIYHFGDYDPSGRDMARHIAEKLREFGAVFTFVEAAVTPEQIANGNLPTRPTKQSDTRARTWKGDSVELDAIPPSELRELVKSCIENHITQEELNTLKTIEREEKARIIDIAQHFLTSTKMDDDDWFDAL